MHRKKHKKSGPKQRMSRRRVIKVLASFVALILLWRGIWGLLDGYLLPDNPMISYLICVLLGIFLVVVDGDIDELES